MPHTLGHKIGGVIKTLGYKGLQFGANYLGSKGDLKQALGKTLLQSIPNK